MNDFDISQTSLMTAHQSTELQAILTAAIKRRVTESDTHPNGVAEKKSASASASASASYGGRSSRFAWERTCLDCGQHPPHSFMRHCRECTLVRSFATLHKARRHFTAADLLGWARKVAPYRTTLLKLEELWSRFADRMPMTTRVWKACVHLHFHSRCMQQKTWVFGEGHYHEALVHSSHWRNDITMDPHDQSSSSTERPVRLFGTGPILVLRTPWLSLEAVHLTEDHTAVLLDSSPLLESLVDVAAQIGHMRGDWETEKFLINPYCVRLHDSNTSDDALETTITHLQKRRGGDGSMPLRRYVKVQLDLVFESYDGHDGWSQLNLYNIRLK